MKALMTGLVLVAGMGLAWADSIELENGDVVSGKITSVDGEKVTLQSDALGELKVERNKVAAIYFGDRKPVVKQPAEALAEVVPQEDAAPSQKHLKSHQTPLYKMPRQPGQNQLDGILGQLQGKGVTPDTMGQLQQQFPLLADPKVSKMFQDKVTGLMTGTLDIQDIRKDAIDALDKIEELEEELGPEGAAALGHYKGILQSFVNRSAPVKGIEPPAESKDSDKEQG
ncbi:hypothetical protein [Calycomorphotria hydatis]|uniref:SLA1 homology domain-containing protein n=1 Tax=Calycomorphotria hydatis TaxID=2528027 RepID=A0A517TAE6_9PLAN|nr:hypothetical protein [Calycomorphotria hydatis]QDT65348.1 hypothetical protein V22_25970 [Calycomorphotria hydatis]